MSFSIKKSPQGLELKGHIDENAVFPAIEVVRAPLLLNFRQVTGINSLGVQRYLTFVDTWSGRPVEYHQISTPLIDAFMMLPALLGPEDNTAHMKSFQVPFSCKKCGESPFMLVQDSDLSVKDGLLVMPSRVCARCSTAMHAGDIAQDYLVFLEMGALRLESA